MEWITVFFCLCFATQSVFSINTDDSKENDPTNTKSIKLNESHNSNDTSKKDESLEESPSEAIRFKKPIILRQRQELSGIANGRGTIKDVLRNTEETESAKDLIKEENLFSPVITFSEAAQPVSEGYWKIIPHSPPYRDYENYGQNKEFRETTGDLQPIIESQSFINKPKMSSVQINYSPAEYLGGSIPEDSSDGNYPMSSKSYDPRNPNAEVPKQIGHVVHTETTRDYGRFLPGEYKSKIEKEAEEMIKINKAQNSTNSERPQTNDGRNHYAAPEQYPAHPQTGHRVFFHLGNLQDPKTYRFPDVFHPPNGEKHIHTSERYPKTEKYPSQQYAYSPENPPPPSREGVPYTSNKPVSSTEANQPHVSYPVKRYPSSQPIPPNAPRQYDYSHEQYHPTYLTGLQGGPTTYPKTSPHTPRPYSTSTEQLPPIHNNDKRKYVDSYATNPNQPADHIRPHYHGEEKNSPILYPLNPNHPADPAVSQYHKGEKKYRHAYAADPNQPTDHMRPHYYSEENTSPISYPANHDHPAVSPYHIGEKNHPVSYTTDPVQHTGHTLPPAKEFQQPLFNGPREPNLPTSNPVPTSEYSASPKQPFIKNVEDPQTTDFHNMYRSLIDLYRSYGFHPLDIEEMPETFPPRFAFGNPFYSKIPVTNPTSGSMSTEDFAPKLKSHEYIRNQNIKSPGHQMYGNQEAPPPHERTKYINDEYNGGQKHFNAKIKETPVRGRETHYYENVPHNSERSLVSTEHQDTSEVSRPGIFDTQVESPKETFSLEKFPTRFYSSPKPTDIPPEGVEIKALRIRDYNPETFYGNPPDKSAYSSEELPFSPISSPPHTAPHSVVRKNPYLLNSNSGEGRDSEYIERPRIYREKIPIIDVGALDKPKKFRPSNTVDASEDVIISDSSFAHDSADNPPNNYNIPKSKKSPAYQSHQWFTKSTSPPIVNKHPKSEISYDHESRGNEKNSPRLNWEKSQEEEVEKQPQKSSRTANTKSRSKKHGKRSSQKRPKKHKHHKRSQDDDNLKAEESTNRWGLERHEGTKGLFQYANVPDAENFEYGYRMGGPEQMTERHHETSGLQSKIKLNWEAKNGDTGDHYWEFNHDSWEDTDDDDDEDKTSKADDPEEDKADDVEESNSDE